MHKKRLAALQILLGVTGIVLVVASYFACSEQLISTLKRVDRMTVGGEFQLEQSAGLLAGFNDIVGDLEVSTLAHEKTIDSALKSTASLSKAVARWESEAIAFAAISRDASHVVDRFQQELPITVPTFDVSSRQVRFRRPEVELGAKEFTVKYPSFTVDTRTELIDLGVKKLELKYPVGLTTKEQSKSVQITDIPEITLVDESVDVPTIEVSHQVLLKAEKAVLLDTSKQLQATSRSLTDTASSLAELRAFMEGDFSNSLCQSKDNLTNVSGQLQQLHVERIPGMITKLNDQRRDLSESQVALAALSDFVPVGFIIFGMIPLSVVLCGLGNLSAASTDLQRE